MARTGLLALASLVLAVAHADPMCNTLRDFGGEQDAWVRARCPLGDGVGESREAVVNVYYVTTHQSLGADFEHCIRLTAESLNVTANITSCNLAPRCDRSSHEGAASVVAARGIELSPEQVPRSGVARNRPEMLP